MGGDEAVARDTGVVDNGVETAELRYRMVDEILGAVPRCDIIGVGDGHSAGAQDLGDDIVGRAGIGTSAFAAAA